MHPLPSPVRPRIIGALGLSALAFVLAACSGGGDSETDRTASQTQSEQAQSEQSQSEQARSQPDDDAQAQALSDEDRPLPIPRPSGADAATDTGILSPERHPRIFRIVAERDFQIPVREPFLSPDVDRTATGEFVLRDENRPHIFGFDWLTNFGIRIVNFDEFEPRLSRDAIRPLTDPAYITVDEANRLYVDGSPMIHIDVDGDVRAFPLEILIWHEIVNDVVGGVPVLITYCPLCNTAIAFDRRLGDSTLSFSTTGLLRNSDLVMYDLETESIWQQIGGKALIGDLVGANLAPIASGIVAWAQFREAFPDALVLARPPNPNPNADPIPYGANPYSLYDDVDAEGDFRRLYRGEEDDRLRFADRVVGLTINGDAIAYPFPLLREQPVIADVVGGQPVLVVWTPGARSALDAIGINAGREVGATAVFDPTLNGALLTFEPNPDDPTTFRDSGTGSTWNIFGRAVQGELSGRQLTPIPHGTHLWFAWVAFEPDTALYE